MSTLFGPVGLLAVGIAAGVLIAAFFLRTAASRNIYVTFAALGLLLGFLVGMSESPLVAAVVTGGFTIAGTLISKFWDRSVSKTETKSDSKIELKSETKSNSNSEERTESKNETTTATTTANNPGSVKADWIMPFALAAFIGVIVGAGIRVNNALDFRDRSIVAHLRAVGFNEQQVTGIMDRLAWKIDATELMKPPLGGSGLHNRPLPPPDQAADPPMPAAPFDWSNFWARMGTNPALSIVENILAEENKNVFPPAIIEIVKTCHDGKQLSDDKIVEHLKALTDFPEKK